MRAHIALDIQVFRPTRLRAYGVQAAGGRVHRDPREQMADAIVNPRNAPLDFGCEILHREIEEAAPGPSRLHLIVSVDDPAKLVAEARRAYDSAWNDPDWEPETVCEAVYEAMIGSAGGPPPVDLGYEILCKGWLDDAPLPTSASPVP